MNDTPKHSLRATEFEFALAPGESSYTTLIHRPDHGRLVWRGGDGPVHPSALLFFSDGHLDPIVIFEGGRLTLASAVRVLARVREVMGVPEIEYRHLLNRQRTAPSRTTWEVVTL